MNKSNFGLDTIRIIGYNQGNTVTEDQYVGMMVYLFGLTLMTIAGLISIAVGVR